MVTKESYVIPFFACRAHNPPPPFKNKEVVFFSFFLFFPKPVTFVTRNKHPYPLFSNKIKKGEGIRVLDKRIVG